MCKKMCSHMCAHSRHLQNHPYTMVKGGGKERAGPHDHTSNQVTASLASLGVQDWLNYMKYLPAPDMPSLATYSNHPPATLFTHNTFLRMHTIFCFQLALQKVFWYLEEGHKVGPKC